MPDSKAVIWKPQRGRGLVTAFDPETMGELWDSFSFFRNVIIQEGAWVCRPGDTTSTPFSPYIKTYHSYNRMFGDGSIASSLLWVRSNGRVDADGVNIYNATSPYELFFETVKNRVFFAGVNNTPKIWDGVHTLLADWGVNGPSGDLGYTSFGASSANAMVAVSVVSCVNGDATVTRVSGASFTTGSDWVGKEIVIDGVKYTILSVTDAGHLELTTTFAGASSPPNYAAIVFYGERTWSLAPKYAYAYYNPNSGHISNVGNVLTLAEQDINGAAVFLTGIQTDAAAYADGYTKIVLFRSPKENTVLFPLPATIGGTGSAVVDADGFIDNLAGPLTYQDNDDDDNHLGAILGRKEAPYRNNKPPNLRLIAYHDGRFFGVEEDRPWRIRWSGGINDISLGVPEECWPEENIDDLRGDDGYATGLKVVGTSLLCQTLRWTYFVAGSGGVYRLERLSTRGFGVNQYAIGEHPGDGSTSSASAIYVARTRKLWRHREGGTITDIGGVIQDRLDSVASVADARPYFVHVFAVGKLWLAAVGILNIRGSLDTYFYDFDQEAWYDWGVIDFNGMTAMDSRVNATMGEWQTFIAIGNPGSTVFTLNDAPGNFHLDGLETGYQATQHWDGGDRNVKKTFDDFELTVSDPNQNWQVSAQYDEDGIERGLTRVTLAGSPRNTGPRRIKFVPTEPRQFHSVRFFWQYPTQGLKVYRAVMNVRPYATGVVGQPS